MSNDHHAQHAIELARECGLAMYYEDPSGHHHYRNRIGEKVYYWNPYENRDHLAVVLREVVRRSENVPMPPKKSIVEDTPIKYLVYLLTKRYAKHGFGLDEWLIETFANDPATIAEAAWQVLCSGKDGE